MCAKYRKYRKYREFRIKMIHFLQELCAEFDLVGEVYSTWSYRIWYQRIPITYNNPLDDWEDRSGLRTPLIDVWLNSGMFMAHLPDWDCNKATIYVQLVERIRKFINSLPPKINRKRIE